MKCLAPMWIKETSDTQGTYVPCGRCYNCIQTKRSIWTFRLIKELHVAESAHFLTLTYEPENVPMVKQYHNWNVMSLKREDLTLFLKRLRKAIQSEYIAGSRWLKQSKSGKWSPRLRYFACGEY